MNCFIILHYQNIKDTIACIDSLKKLEEPKKIIVVDNHSLNLKEEEKLKKICDDLITLEENIGFAKANNQGCELAITKYKPKFLIVINNDTIIKQKDFLKIVNQDYQKYKFAILGPKIITNNGDSVNPFPVYKTLSEVNKQIKYSKKLVFIYNSKILTNLLNIYLKLKRKFIKPKVLHNGDKIVCNVALHGCALIFSKLYYEKNKDIFDSRTFLYHEEEFLYQRMLKQKFITLYDPNLEIFHKEGGSLNQKFNSDTRLKNKYRQQEIIKSLEILKQDMLKNRVL